MEKISYPEKLYKFITLVTDEVKKGLDPELIIMVGSFGKGSWLYSGETLLSDFEFVFIRRHKWSIKKKKDLLIRLNTDSPYNISLKGYLLKNVQKKILSNYSIKKNGYLDLSYYDTFTDPQIIYSRKNEIPELPVLNIKDIPAWEAWRLLTNRIGDILTLFVNDNMRKAEETYYWLKCFESIADSFLIVNKLYDKNIIRRLKIFDKYLNNNDYSELSTVCKNSFELLKLSLQARQEHELAKFEMICLSLDEKINILREWLYYIECKMCIEENLLQNKDFHEKYLLSNRLQNKYLETNLIFNVFFSNFIRIINHPGLIYKCLNKYNIRYSWRHVILLTITEIFREYALNNGLYRSRELFNKITTKENVDRLNNKAFIRLVLNYWKILR